MTARNENEEDDMDSESAYIVNAFGVAVNVFLQSLCPENKKEFQKKLTPSNLRSPYQGEPNAHITPASTPVKLGA